MADISIPPKDARLLPMTGADDSFVLFAYLSKNPFDDSWHNYRDFDKVLSAGTITTGTDGKKWLKAIGYNGDIATFTGFLDYGDRNVTWFDVPTAIAEPPGPIPLFAAIPASMTTVNLTWDNPDRVNVEIDRQEGESGTFTKVVRLDATTEKYTDRNLKANTTYYYRIFGISVAGYGPYSDSVSATTDAAPVVPAPTPSTTTSASTGQTATVGKSSATATKTTTTSATWLQTNWKLVATVVAVISAVFFVITMRAKRS